MNYLIGIDVGTSATKTVLFDEGGHVAASASREYPLYQPHNGWAEQKPEDWRDAVLETLSQVVTESGVLKEDIKGIGISGQMHGLVMLDENNEVIRPSIIWCDQRTGAEVEDMLNLMPRERWIEITANPPLTGWTAAKILWVRKNEPEHYQRCRHILLPKDYIRFVLTGIYATEVSDASGMQLLDVPGRCWSDEVLHKLDIDPELLGNVFESCEVTGSLLPEIAERTGLSIGTKVVGGAGDNAAAAVGTGVVRDGTAFTTIGTSGVVFAHSSQVTIDPKGRVHTCCSAVPGAWHVMGVTQAAGLSLKWFKDNLCHDYVEEAKRQGVDVYDLINKDVSQVEAGSDKLIYLPYLMGERTPHLDPDCRGVFFGLSAIHTKAHMLRAVMEGVSYSLSDCNDILKEMGILVGQMMACGGGGKSPVWRQMLADMYDCEVKTVVQTEGPALGVAILAGVGCGIYESVEAACDALISEDKLAGPNARQAELYSQYHQLYKKLYADLKDSYKMLAAL
ncbi:xylulokinase [Clostridium sp. Marseille-P2415]|uniref:xylulokinase n=1 Tax=Clostridium sp. Marseille-P2415 TaxID=1805471 RepID=UPI00098864A8|nr:xylulokinase [Clostridium sp. Marseille-P2415]